MKKSASDAAQVSSLLKRKRKEMGLTQKEMAERIGTSGERSIRRWESGTNKPVPAMMETILSIPNNTPYRTPDDCDAFSFIDLFAGIGGTRLGFQQHGGHCVFTSEWDKYAQKTYAANFGEVPSGDITLIKAEEIPDHDVLVAGFPCQAFSQAGLKQGFGDTRGTMFFEIQRIMAEKRPKAFLLENVKQLKGHDKGRTLQTILDILRGEHLAEIPDNLPLSQDARKALGARLNYYVDYRVLKAADYGVPQNRERIYIVGFDKDAFPDCDFKQLFKWPEASGEPTRLGDILEDNKSVDPKYTISDKLWNGHKRRREEHKAKGNGFGYSLFNFDSAYANTISARYYKDGSEILIDQSEIGKNPRKLTPRECARLQGFPEDYVISAVSDVQVYKQFGNSVALPVVRAIAGSIVGTLKTAHNKARNSKKKYG